MYKQIQHSLLEHAMHTCKMNIEYGKTQFEYGFITGSKVLSINRIKLLKMIYNTPSHPFHPTSQSKDAHILYEFNLNILKKYELIGPREVAENLHYWNVSSVQSEILNIYYD